MIKENHLALAGCDLEQALERLRREVGTGVRITAEASDKEEACAAVRGGADVILLDNFSPEGLLDLCPLLRDQARDLGREVELEASGGIRLETVAAFATTGVERLSIGALTHSVQALDLSLYLEPLSAEPEAGP